MNILIKRTNALIIAAALSGFFVSAPVQAQAGFNNSGWSPQASNRASIAALIRQVEEDDSTSSGAYAVGSTVTQLICGSSSGEGGQTSANAQANSSCIILNNSEGSVLSIDQLSDGDQDANAQSTEMVTVDETINYDAGDADDVLDVLAGNTE